MRLYMHPLATTARPLMLLAAIEDIPLELIQVDLLKGEQHRPEFTRINPNRLLPVLEDDDFILTESSAILKYLADSVGSSLYPAQGRLRARVNERMDWFNTDFYREWGYHFIYPQVLPHHSRATDSATRLTVEWGRAKSVESLATLDQHILGANKYVCGHDMTIADLFGAEILSIGELVRVDLSRYRRVQAWLDRMRMLPAWLEVNAAHSAFAEALNPRSFAGLVNWTLE